MRQYFETQKTFKNWFFPDVETWKLSSNGADLFIRAAEVPKAKAIFDQFNISYDIFIDDVQSRIENENPPIEDIDVLQNRNGLCPLAYNLGLNFETHNKIYDRMQFFFHQVPVSDSWIVALSSVDTLQPGKYKMKHLINSTITHHPQW